MSKSDTETNVSSNPGATIAFSIGPNLPRPIDTNGLPSANLINSIFGRKFVTKFRFGVIVVEAAASEHKAPLRAISVEVEVEVDVEVEFDLNTRTCEADSFCSFINCWRIGLTDT